MKCISCSADIDPKWKFAIEQNTCPLCGQLIMEEELKHLLTSLSDIMNKLEQYPEQLNDWLLSNFNYIKTDSPKLNIYASPSMKSDKAKHDNSELSSNLVDLEELEVTEHGSKKDNKFIVKVKTDSGEQEVEAEKIQPEEKTNEFFKRAEAVKPNIDGFRTTAEKTEHLKKIALQIKRAGSTSITSETGENSIISPEMMEDADPDTIAEMESLFTENQISSSLNTSSDDDEIPPVVLNMANRAKNSKHTSNPADILKLQQLQNRLQESRKNFESGNNRGKGSFSRV